MALTLLATNNAESTLASAISATDTSLIVSAGTGAEFPDAVAGESYFKLTLTDAATGSQVEIVNVTAKAGDIFTIERAQEGTLARAWAANDMVANMMTADTLNIIAQYAQQAAASAEQAGEYAGDASDYARNKFTFFKTASDPDGTIAGLAATTDGQSFWVAQGPDALSAAWQYQNKAGVAVLQAKQPGTAAVTGTIREFPTLEAAQADADAGNIPTGSTAYYRSADDATLAIEVINTSGTLQPTGRTMISEQGVEKKIDTRLPPGDYTQDYFPAYHDKQGNVLMWFDNSCPDAAGLGPQLQEVVSSIPNLWAKNYLRQFDFDPAYFPLIFDKNGNVSLWMNDQRPDAAGLGPQLQEVVKNISGANSVSTFIEGDKYKFTFKQGRIFNGAPTSLNVAFTGDSWTEKNTIPQSLINLLGGNYKDPGFISCSTRTDGVMAGITLSVSNFTKYDGDNENNNAPPPYGSGPDGNAYYNVNAVGTLTWSNVKVTELSVFYYDGTGTFTITIDGVAPITINGGNTGVAKKYDISGLSATLHTVVIASSGVGVVSILGMYGKNNSISSGFTVSRMGNGGAIASDYLYWKDWIPQIVSSMDIDLLFIVLGTNDFRKSKGISEYKNGIQTIIEKYRIATPGICLCLVSPAQCNAAGVPALSEYDIAMRELALDNKTSFISGYQSFPDVYDNSGGAWVDALHLSNAGAYVLTRKIKDKFFQEL
ncbi:GDSL family lipase [Klebsiella quasipneumoniae subsp. similipneumoniae]|uniref:GDSL family lipase n=1 Tax=Klebsiella quasipneumoniae subsp. similipneumoniae TaxID=1463164 RepID=A0AAE4MTV2_9ENTR|nr:GDSL family lipase [Klebsiella quasipneumoniae]MDV0613229.1 GDSL family lipase [Klebsiella quasipneumoniae subsp. similipneumoniae]MDV0640955.1 GDSL family lipase [Klebsiella quasipneumoniae subsp. similipneumoniae]MDV0728021.1 GDSL family lipase [Klebsiella quasipneumoniae subsp. similipneumoniae]MDV0739603.1 GDSL family lipase [Klebsiella quasipneumoniae subsp. similipneumoniae]MDV0765599.1 GDSL family lipase [Klebsiella quasipneumoniae subsp. similipneumoniae]